MDLRNTKIKINSEEESRLVQEYAFKQGFSWSGDKIIKHINNPYLYFSKYYMMSYGDTEIVFNDEPSKEIFISSIIQPKIYEVWT